MNHLTPYPLFERKQVGILYHFTETTSGLKSILSSGTLISSDYNYVSFTRDYKLRYKDGEVRLVFDGDRLSDYYSIQPFGYRKTRLESEERILGDTVAFKDALVAVDILDNRIDYQQRIDSSDGKPQSTEYYLKQIDNFNFRMERLHETYPHIVFNTVAKFTPYRA